jgi:two-component system nitrogen regulation response regulator GlnG/two-component system response regulator HydG
MLVVLWTASEPARVGEALLPRASGDAVFGRGDEGDPGEARAALVRQRPGENARTPPLDNPFLSRRQMRLRGEAGGVLVESLGKRPLLHDDREVPAGGTVVVAPGETLEIKGQILFLCAARPRVLPELSHLAVKDAPTFGEPDAHGIVGESPAVWELRDQYALVGALSAHVLLTGDSGTGKELAARAIHASSARRAKKLVARNAATFPPGIIDAELFGNVANYPNAGMPERAGVVGEADGGTLFLDEVAELPHELQSHLLRVLDEGGDYQRLGDARRRHADLRVVAATNRAPEELKHDLAARLSLRVELPGLNERREDVPLLARDLLRRRARKDAPIGARFFAGWDGKEGEPRLSPALVRALALHRYATHVRELDSLLLRSLTTSRGGSFDLTPAVKDEVVLAPARERPAAAREYTAEEVRAALAKHGGVRERAYRELGMPSRHVLLRVMKKLGIDDAG